MPSSIISSKGQVTIPKEIREEMGLKPGTHVFFVKDRDGRLAMRPITDFMSLRGIIQSPHKKPVTIKEMNEAIARGYAGLR